MSRDPLAPQITFDGRPLRVRPGHTIAATLLTAGIRSWPAPARERAEGATAQAGLFCGIGVCFGCLVTVNGRSGVRACLVEARPGDAVTSGGGVA
jgi:hypothetical protein